MQKRGANRFSSHCTSDRDPAGRILFIVVLTKGFKSQKASLHCLAHKKHPLNGEQILVVQTISLCCSARGLGGQAKAAGPF